MKMPEPMMPPITTMVASNGPSDRSKLTGASYRRRGDKPATNLRFVDPDCACGKIRREAEMRRTAVLALLLWIALPSAGPLGAQAAQETISTERLTRIDRALQAYIDQNQVAGLVALVLRDGVPVYERAFGWADKEAGRRMSVNTIFRIASQTKAITSASILMLVEEGKLGVTDPVSRYIPAFAKTTVAVRNGNHVNVVPGKRAITIRDLLTHTAGISYGTTDDVAARYQVKGLGPAAGAGWYTADKTEPICSTMEKLGTLPFVAQPGEAWVYGYNTDILGCIVERVSGTPLDEFVRTRITAPLGMIDTQFFLPATQRDRLAAVYASAADGKAVRAADDARGQGLYVDGPRKSFSGGAGLLSTARDYARFLEMIRNHGALGNVRILSPRATKLMTTNQSGTLHSTDGLGFGFGFETTDRYGAAGMQSVGSFGWGGAYGSVYRVDPDAGLTMVFMMQLMPNRTDVRERFPNLVYQALVEQ
jgi:CubicO group peptidase (beta-lactamase class C family)